MRPDEFEKANVRFTCCPPSREWLLSIPAKEYLTHELTPVHPLGRRNRIRRQRDEETMITDIDIFEAATNYGCIVGTVEFDEWMKAHDAEVRNEAIIARDTRTPVDLIQAAFEAAYPVPEGRKVQAGVPLISRWKDGDIWFHAMGRIPVTPDRVEYRTMEPLPPVIPDDCMAVWAGSEWMPDGVRALWVRKSDVLWQHIVTQAEARKWCDDVDGFDILTAEDDELIDPVPIPEEES